MRFVIVGRSRFTNSRLELELDASDLAEATRRAERLGLVDVEARAAEHAADADRADGQAGPTEAAQQEGDTAQADESAE